MSARETAGFLRDLARDSVERLRGRQSPLTPPLRLRRRVGPFNDARLYEASAERNLAALRTVGQLQPSARILDLGCGTGRMAAALTRFLTSGARYEGFDVNRSSIEWCRRHITARHPNFRFTWIDVRSDRYNPGGRERAEAIRLPYPDGAFDFAYAGSLYTHVLAEQVENYLRETARVLAPDGRTFSTFCLLTPTTTPQVLAGRTSPPLPEWFGDCRVRSLADPADFIAFPEPTVREIYARAGLRLVEPIRHGSWAALSDQSEMAHPTGFNQDIVLAAKPARD